MPIQSPNTLHRGGFTQQTGTTNFLNRTELSDEEAKGIVEQARKYVISGEEYAVSRLERGQRGRDVAQGKIWNEEDEEFFQGINMTQYTFNIQRPFLNHLYETQQAEKIRFRIAPKDLQAYYRYQDGREKYISEHAHEFGSEKEAGEYFDQNVDDEFGNMLTALMMDTRQNCNAKDEESEWFRGGIETGQHFIKAIWSDKYDRSGGVEIKHVPQNAIIYDEVRSTRYELDDIRFIGERKELYPEDLQELYPDVTEQIEKLFASYMTHQNYLGGQTMVPHKWKDFFNYESGINSETSSSNLKIKLTELWTRDTEERVRVIDNVNNSVSVANYGVEAEKIFEQLITQMFEQQYNAMLSDENTGVDDLEYLISEDHQNDLRNQVMERFVLDTINEPIWYKTVFSYNALFEYIRSPYPHYSHPYQGYFPQFNEGDSRGVIEDVLDVLIAYQKAMAFRELIMAHGAKKFVLIDKRTLERNNMKEEDLAERWTEIGGVLALDLGDGDKMSDIAFPVDTVGGGGLEAYVERMIENYERLIAHIIGVTEAQLGQTQGETPSSRFQAQLRQARGNNGVVYRSFLRAMTLLYKKELMMEIELLKYRRKRVVRLLGDEYSSWSDAPFLTVEWNQDMELFEESIRTGQFGMTLIPEQETPQLHAAREGMMFEMAQIDPEFPTELALKYSSHPQRHKIIRDMRSMRQKRQQEELVNMVDLQIAQQILLSQGSLTVDQVDSILKQMKLQNEKQQQSKQNQQSGQRTKIVGKTARGGIEDQRVADRTTLNAEQT